MHVVLGRAWQQKHPSPTHSGWDFHWHPFELPGAAEAIAGATSDEPVAVWSIGPRHAVWLRGFVAVATAEQRRYVGWSGCAAEPADDDAVRWAEALPDVLARFTLPPARPFQDGDPAGRQLGKVEAAGHLLDAGLGEDESVARSLHGGGEAAVGEPHDPEWPALWGRMLSWLPPSERARPRAGVLRMRVPTPALPESARNLHHYLHRSWRCGARRPWRLVLELCAAERRTLAELFDELTALAGAWDRASDLMGYLAHAGVPLEASPPAVLSAAEDAGRLWNRVLHYWGRGLFGSKKSLLDALAAVLARRITVDHLLALDTPGRADPERYLRRLRFEALLTERDVRALRMRLRALLPSLEVHRERA